MTHLFFPDQASAIAAVEQIGKNVRAYVAKIYPERLTPDGALRGINAATGQLSSAGVTTRWAIPEAYQSGWIIPSPTAEQVAPIPLAGVLHDVGGEPITPVEVDHGQP